MLLLDKVEENGETSFVIKRSQDKFVKGKRILIVEDVLTTGGSVKKVSETILAMGGIVVGVGALCNRGNVLAEAIGVPVIKSLINVTLDAFDEADCPLCARNIPINTAVGKGADFLKRKEGSSAKTEA